MASDDRGCLTAAGFIVVVVLVIGWIGYSQHDDGPGQTVVPNPCPAKVLYKMMDEVYDYLAKRPPDVEEAKAVAFDPTERVSRECGIGRYEPNEGP